MQPSGCSFGARNVPGNTILTEDPRGCVDQFPPTAVQFILLQRCPKVQVYDANGNQQIEQPAIGNRRTTTWNYENQPTLYRLPAGSRVTMINNGDNRRVRIQEP